MRQCGGPQREVVVGTCARPTLVCRVVPRHAGRRQTMEVIDRHANEAGIIYCIRRKDVDELTEPLRKNGCNALPYHAGLAPEEQRSTQADFLAENSDLEAASDAIGTSVVISTILLARNTTMT